MSHFRIIVTGEHHDDLPALQYKNKPIQWQSASVLEFKRLPIDPVLLQSVEKKPFEWIVFCSPRAVRFWSETLMEAGIEFPLESQVACIGQSTAEVADIDGFTPDFFPTEPGTEKFLEEFEDLLSNNGIKPTIIIPMAEAGRKKIPDRLAELGCPVTTVSLYRTLPKADISQELTQDDLNKAQAILFTSPSSFDAIASHLTLPDSITVVALGEFTANHLTAKGIKNHKRLPQSDFSRITEVL